MWSHHALPVSSGIPALIPFERGNATAAVCPAGVRSSSGTAEERELRQRAGTERSDTNAPGGQMTPAAPTHRQEASRHLADV